MQKPLLLTRLINQAILICCEFVGGTNICRVDPTPADEARMVLNKCVQGSDEYNPKLNKIKTSVNLADFISVCNIINISYDGTKDDIAKRILLFLCNLKLSEDDEENEEEDYEEEEENKESDDVQKEIKDTFIRRRKPARRYKIGDWVTIKRSQFTAKTKIRPKFLGPYDEKVLIGSLHTMVSDPDETSSDLDGTSSEASDNQDDRDVGLTPPPLMKQGVSRHSKPGVDRR
ncbi:hypothetical protein ILUMI_19732 [Ignelater luminosus]|uniref:Uncharacterized protein n=1 Tax=Ignelater luminosus TaxID=2038154 RepID=A0A8K0G5A9_IGNLU|nr:hypothetical protein ILUMI_19732 [Ignelater luminosus]